MPSGQEMDWAYLKLPGLARSNNGLMIKRKYSSSLHVDLGNG